MGQVDDHAQAIHFFHNSLKQNCYNFSEIGFFLGIEWPAKAPAVP